MVCVASHSFGLPALTDTLRWKLTSEQSMAWMARDTRESFPRGYTPLVAVGAETQAQVEVRAGRRPHERDDDLFGRQLAVRGSSAVPGCASVATVEPLHTPPHVAKTWAPSGTAPKNDASAVPAPRRAARADRCVRDAKSAKNRAKSRLEIIH